MKLVIVDDDRLFAEELEKQIIRYGTENNIEFEIEKAESAMALLINSKSYDVYFLDVEMPGMDGISLARELRKKYCYGAVVFVSHHEEYVWKSFDVGVSSFVRKGFLQEDLPRTLEILQKKMQVHKKEVEIPNNKGSEWITPRSVLYCKSREHYVKFFYMDDSEKVCRTGLAEVEEKLEDYGFVRIHSRYLVNLNYLKTVTNKSIEMVNGENLPVSRKYSESFHQRLAGWMTAEREGHYVV